MAQKLLMIVFISLYLLAAGATVEFSLAVFLLSTDALPTGDDVDKKVLASLAVILIASILSALFIAIHTMLAWKSMHTPNYTLERNPLHITCAWMIRFTIVLWSVTIGLGLDIVMRGLGCGEERPEEKDQNILALCEIYKAIVAVAILLLIISWAATAHIKATRSSYAVSILGIQYDSSTEQSNDSAGNTQDSNRNTLLSSQGNQGHSRTFEPSSDGNWYELEDMSGRPSGSQGQSSERQNSGIRRSPPQERVPHMYGHLHSPQPSHRRRHTERRRSYADINFPYSPAGNTAQTQVYRGTQIQGPSAGTSQPLDNHSGIPRQSYEVSGNTRGFQHHRQPPATRPRGPRPQPQPAHLSTAGLVPQPLSLPSRQPTSQNTNPANPTSNLTSPVPVPRPLNITPRRSTQMQRPRATLRGPRPEPRAAERSALRRPEQTPLSSIPETREATVPETEESSRNPNRRTLSWEDEEVARENRLPREE